MGKKFYVFVVLMLLLGVGFYASLGGFNKVEVGVVSAEALHMVGRYYEGPPKGEAFNNLFRQAGQLVEEQVLQGELGGIYYTNPHAETDTVKAFVGVIVASPGVRLPEGYTLRQLPAGRPVLQAAVDAHYLLAPNLLYPALFDYAAQNNLELRQEYVERFSGTRRGVVQVPVEGR